MTRRMTVLVAGAAVATLGLTACSGGSGSGTAAGGDTGSSAKKVTSIKLVAAEYSKDHTAAFWKQFAEKYKAKTGNTLDVQVVSWDDIDQQSSTMIQNNNPPDILNLNAYASYAKDDLLYSADDVLSPAVKSDLLDAFVKSGTYQGKMYGMPDLSSARALFYNKAMFTKAGIAAPPKTWAEFEADAKKIRASAAATSATPCRSARRRRRASSRSGLFNNGGDWKSDGKWTINSPKNVETLTFLKKLAVQDKVTQNNPGKTNRADALQPVQVRQRRHGGRLLAAGRRPRQGQEGQLRRRADADAGRRRAADLRRHRLPDGVQEAGQPGGRQGVLRPVLPAGPGQHVHQGRGLPAGHQDRPAGVRVRRRSSRSTWTPCPTCTSRRPTTRRWDKVKLAVQQNIGAGINGDPKAVLDDLQKPAETAADRGRRPPAARACRLHGTPPPRRGRPPAGPAPPARRRRRDRSSAGVALLWLGPGPAADRRRRDLPGDRAGQGLAQRATPSPGCAGRRPALDNYRPRAGPPRARHGAGQHRRSGWSRWWR